MFRWQVQRGVIVIPKSVTPARIVENSSVFDFKLTDAEMQALCRSIYLQYHLESRFYR